MTADSTADKDIAGFGDYVVFGFIVALRAVDGDKH
jgi:hypothetical protein